MGISGLASRVAGGKRRWRQYKARTRALGDDPMEFAEALGPAPRGGPG